MKLKSSFLLMPALGLLLVGCITIVAPPDTNSDDPIIEVITDADEKKHTEKFEVNDRYKVRLMKKCAPRVWLHSDEKYWPSSVEWSFNFTQRVWRNDNWWLVTRKQLKKPSSVLPYFQGCDPNQQHTGIPCNFDEVPAYAFWNEVEIAGEGKNVVDIVYFFYYPYNRGKSAVNTIFGSHVGDWEHITVRLYWQQSEKTGKWLLAPAQGVGTVSIHIAAHDFGGDSGWNEIPKVRGTEHPIVYAAWGSHGTWKEAGNFTYKKIIMKTKKLIDRTNEGTAWDTWKNLEMFDYNAKKGLGPTWKGSWPTWMEKDNSSQAMGGQDPASGPVYRWGNSRMGKVKYPPFRKKDYYYRLVDGPVGPVDKGYWNTPELD